MLADRFEGKWIDLFAEVFALCKVAPGDACAILSESQSRALNVQLAELALHRLGARPFHVVVPTPRQTAPVPSGQQARRCSSKARDPRFRRSPPRRLSPIARSKA